MQRYSGPNRTFPVTSSIVTFGMTFLQCGQVIISSTPRGVRVEELGFCPASGWAPLLPADLLFLRALVLASGIAALALLVLGALWPAAVCLATAAGALGVLRSALQIHQQLEG
jgi:hypothetical protein